MIKSMAVMITETVAIDVPNVIKICCSIFQLSAVTCAVVNGLTIITSEREVNGMVIESCTDILLQEIS